jgi:acyl carrier protein
MNSGDVKDKLLLFFQNNILYNESMNEIDGDESLIDNGYIDSTGIIGLVTFIEKTFNFRVYDHEIIPENFDSINSIYTYINKKMMP